MWEESATCGVDASILSKVLCGKRLFTPQQLDVFCRSLGIEHAEKEYLFYCLNKDYNLKHGVILEAPFTPSSCTQEFIENLVQESESLFQAGKWKDLYQLSSLLESYLQQYAARVYESNSEDRVIALYQRILYFQAKSMGSIRTPKTIIQETRMIIQKLRRYTTSTCAPFMHGYAKSFETIAYGVVGIYSSSQKFQYLHRAMESAAQAMQTLQPTNNEHLFALRSRAAYAILLNNEEIFRQSLKTAKRLLPMQPATNFLSSMQLAGTLEKGIAVFKLDEPFILKEESSRRFNRSLSGAGVHELSDIKTELETHIALKSRKDTHIEQKIQRALTLANEESEHYKGVIETLAGQF